MSGTHPSWTLALNNAGAHSFVFQHPLAAAPLIPLIPHIWAMRITVVFSPEFSMGWDAALRIFSQTHFDSG